MSATDFTGFFELKMPVAGPTVTTDSTRTPSGVVAALIFSSMPPS